MNHFAVAIDGPAGSGKSTVARLVAKKLGFLYIDTGAMYRGVAYGCQKAGVSTKEEEAVVSQLDKMQITVKHQNGGQRLLLDGEDITEEIRTPAVGQGASEVGLFLPVREKLVELQRNLAKEENVIMDGRDIGTNVLPDAEVKIFLTADVDARTKRRMGELEAKGELPDYETIRRQILARDYQDCNREHNPLKKAQDALEIDSSSMTIEEVANQIIDCIQNKISI